MRTLFLAVATLLNFMISIPAFAAEMPKPESIVEKMTFKFARGVTNFATAIVELPKQTILTGRNHGAVGYMIGPINGVGMTLYRGLIGLTEAVFFLVPQPGYYDPMMDPEFVWQGWDEQRAELPANPEKAELDEPHTGQKESTK